MQLIVAKLGLYKEKTNNSKIIDFLYGIKNSEKQILCWIKGKNNDLVCQLEHQKQGKNGKLDYNIGHLDIKTNLYCMAFSSLLSISTTSSFKNIFNPLQKKWSRPFPTEYFKRKKFLMFSGKIGSEQ